MRRYKKGDLAVTVNSRAPLFNNGHVVQITEVIGPMPGFGIDFGYSIERIDGQAFLYGRSSTGEPKIPCKVPVYVHHWQLRPIAKKRPGGVARRSRRRVPETS